MTFIRPTHVTLREGMETFLGAQVTEEIMLLQFLLVPINRQEKFITYIKHIMVGITKYCASLKNKI